jgi:hypothetical protein
MIVKVNVKVEMVNVGKWAGFWRVALWEGPAAEPTWKTQHHVRDEHEANQIVEQYRDMYAAF